MDGGSIGVTVDEELTAQLTPQRLHSLRQQLNRLCPRQSLLHRIHLQTNIVGSESNLYVEHYGKTVCNGRKYLQ